MNTLNKSGPNIDPWGAPFVNFAQLLRASPSLTRWLRIDR